MTRVAIIGVGGLGCPAAQCLAEAQVPLALFDGDRVERHNLPRQLLYREEDLGRSKVAVARARLRPLGGDVQAHAAFIRGAEGLRALEGCDVWLDAVDSLEAKLWLSDRAVERGVTLIHGGATRLVGQALLVSPGQGPCLRCLLGEVDEGLSCRQAGILGPVVGLVGALMARLTLEALSGRGLAGALITVDARTGSLRERTMARRPDCPACSKSRSPGASCSAQSPRSKASPPTIEPQERGLA
ncbi:MAG: HesA/MoeB/ThiF family protein [Deltaproteobacteria bacterium]